MGSLPSARHRFPRRWALLVAVALLVGVAATALAEAGPAPTEHASPDPPLPERAASVLQTTASDRATTSATAPVVPSSSPTTRPARSVLILGDSGTVDASPALVGAFLAAGATHVASGAAPGFGLTIDDGWRTAWADEVARHHPDLVVVTMGGWDTAAIERDGSDAYTALVDEAVGILAADGARVLWTSMLPGGHDPRHPADPVFAALPARHRGRVAYLDLDLALRTPQDARSVDAPAEAPAWPRAYVDAAGRTVVLRKPDAWHLCPEGAARVAAAVADTSARLGWSDPPSERWRDAPWYTSGYYDDPPGACGP